ncbi:Uncharacterized protein SAPIO_CDS7453 [Scedosporium apiospermum]|uniref:C2 NT-type domain-containing protein n=1 Tax=Pseudallescheria apiosperma TaxID=563466 RepID=A0A084G1X9_PSEDA|nr:Uncharacterized protein SAPIO_CDS7453 [Scedosporium apiospermum]KEZ41341.1 Uncharacterized protein SAPIO_CDS7453 [Scedosporium apiospermum]
MHSFKRKIFSPKLTQLSNQPKFELHLKIYDLNNVPLVSGYSFIKWHITSSIHAEHRGRTQKCPIANHRVDYNYAKVVPSIRIGIDRNASLGECFIEFEVLQEFPVGGGARDERILLGVVRLNLSEFVEESDAITTRKRSASLSVASFATAMGSPGSMAPPPLPRSSGADGVAEEGIMRRYLMQESKINSTLKIGILMVQIDGERNYVAPPLKTAAVFGGIAGIMAGDQAEQDEPGQIANLSKSRDAAEVQDLYRHALTASWCAQPDEHPADAVIENLFSGGDGWNLSSARLSTTKPLPSPFPTTQGHTDDDLESSGSLSGDEGQGGTIRPSDFRNAQRRFAHRNHHALSLTSQRSSLTINSIRTIRPERRGGVPVVSRTSAKDDDVRRSRSDSLTSLAPTLGSSDRGMDPGVKRAMEISEAEARDDLVAWRLGGITTMRA